MKKNMRHIGWTIMFTGLMINSAILGSQKEISLFFAILSAICFLIALLNIWFIDD